MSLRAIRSSFRWRKKSQRKRTTVAVVIRSCTSWNGVTPLLNKNLEAEAAEAQKVAAATTNR
jgi:hypothetical protein